ncbi:hypothetical protein B0F90DRAFT_1805354 [Multifurca ochricompacta]|uniref:Uncharacterized protein n=1 Tax=Multifurca ochricompacta TaxID=376703 RepID=A0AAD4LTV7_9AGAM|nr:hypothetical protein B0F90DRAFT_1805354 [Multifurca ochricompacta]
MASLTTFPTSSWNALSTPRAVLTFSSSPATPWTPGTSISLASLSSRTCSHLSRNLGLHWALFFGMTS